MKKSIESPIKSLNCVEFPGKVVNVDRAVQCLGGLNKISNACVDQAKLECRFRPDNLFCKPAVADRDKSTSFVLKVLVKKKKSVAGDSKNTVVDASVIGKVEQVFKFCNLNEFQYLPMKKDAEGMYKSVYNSVVPKPNLPLTWDTDVVPLFLPPIIFSRMDSVQSYLTTKVTEESSGLIGKTRDRRSNYVKFVSHDMKEVPTSPNQHTFRYIKLKFVTEEQIQHIKELFEKRPVWTKSALECVTRFSEMQLKYLLALNAYHFTSGPFRIAWVRFGYDPRLDKSAKKYQILDYRLRNYVLSIMRERLPDKYSRGKTKIIRNENHENKYDPFDESHYKFRPGFMPPQKQVFYQICDIEIPEVQEKLNNFSEDKTYDSKNGWLTELFLENIRETIDKHVLATATGSNGADNNSTALDLLAIENVEIRQDDFAEEMDFDVSDQDDYMDADDL